MTNPVVSIMVPCYNSAETLPRALASLVAQTYSDWECIVVDDGSTDDPRSVIETFRDSRIRLIRFPHNRGRPAARQAALDASKGELLAMLDADDWLYPWKLERQVALLERYGTVAAVGAGMMVYDKNMRAVGVQPYRLGHEGMSRVHRLYPGPPPLVHGPVMLRMREAKRASYDIAMPRGEDTDFLTQVLLGKECLLLMEPLYAYRELDRMTYRKVVAGLRSDIRRYEKFKSRYPWRSRTRIVQTRLKYLVYRSAELLGQFHRLVGMRSRSPTASELSDYRYAHGTVAAVLQEFIEAKAAAKTRKSAGE